MLELKNLQQGKSIMINKADELKQNFIALYEGNNGEFKVEVRVSEETVWLSLNQISALFERDKSVISRHLKKVFSENELDRTSVVAFFATTASDGKKYDVEYFNLDAILSVGYRVNSKKGIKFRRWASNILKEYMLKGYSLNQEHIMKDKVQELQSAIDLMRNALSNTNLITSPGTEIIEIIRSYSKTWDLLIKYDEDKLETPHLINKSSEILLSYNYAKELIEEFKKELGVAGLFGIEREEALKGILGNILQSFDGEYLYQSLEEKAAHLLYFVIKDHPFSDGNKRIGSFLFLLFLKLSKISTDKMNENTLTAIALLTAESKPEQKNLMIKLIMNLIE